MNTTNELMNFNDSRFAGQKWYKKIHLKWIFNTSTFVGNFVIALIVSYFFRQLGYGNAVDFVFLLGVLSIGLWVTEAIPPFAVGILIIAMLLFGFGTDFLLGESLPVEKYVATWTSNVVWLLLGGFFLAEGLKEAELDRALFRFTVRRFGNNPERLLLGLMLVTAFASMIMSNTATTAMMVSSILPLIKILGKSSNYSKALLTGIPAAASIGGIGTIIGSTPNAIAIGALQEKGIQISFIQWMILGIPTGLFLVYVFYKFLLLKLDLQKTVLDMSEIFKSEKVVNPFKRRVVIFTLIATVALWVTEPFHGIHAAAISAVPIVILTLTQVINSDLVRALPWDTLMLVAGGLALGIALVDVGLSDIVMNQVKNLPLPNFVLAFIFSLIAVLLSNVMSNTAAASILIPLAVTLSYPFSIAVPVIVAISCSCSLLLPVSTPSNAIAYGTGFIEQKEFRRGGLFFILAGPVSAFIAVMIWVRLYL